MKILKILLVFILVFCILQQSVYASEIFELGKKWLQTAKQEATGSTGLPSGLNFATSYDKLEEMAGLLMVAGIFIIIAAGMIIGIKYLISPVEKRAALKKALIAYAAGSILILGALGIWKFAIEILQDLY